MRKQVNRFLGQLTVCVLAGALWGCSSETEPSLSVSPPASPPKRVAAKQEKIPPDPVSFVLPPALPDEPSATDVYDYAASLTRQLSALGEGEIVMPSDLIAGLDTVDAFLVEYPRHALTPKLLMLTGKLKQRIVIGGCGHFYKYKTHYPPDSANVCRKQLGAYAADHNDEFHYNEINGSHFYDGNHLRRLLKEFPDHELADDTAYQLTQLPEGGECEGYVTCYIGRGTRGVLGFLRAYPNSEFAPEAVTRANNVFSQLSDFEDLAAESEYYSPDETEALLRSYQSVVQDLPVRERLQAYRVIAPLMARLLQYEEARSMYAFVLENSAGDTSEIYDALSKLPDASLHLAPPRVVSYNRIDLEWTYEGDGPVKEFRLYRAQRNSQSNMIATLPGTQTRYTDQEKLIHFYEYRYRILAVTDENQVVSEFATAQPISMTNRARAFLYDSDLEEFSIFGFLVSGTPEIIRLGTDGVIRERISGTFFGLERDAFSEHANDEFTEERWFVDPANQSYLRFPLSDADWRANLESAMESGSASDLVGDGPPSPGGWRVAVSRDQGKMRMAEWDEMDGTSTLFWDVEDDIEWTGSRASIAVMVDESKTEYSVPLEVAGEAPSAILPSSTAKTAWVHYPVLGRLILFDTDGDALNILEVPPNAKIVTDKDRDVIWIVNTVRYSHDRTRDGQTGSYNVIVRRLRSDGQLLRQWEKSHRTGGPHGEPSEMFLAIRPEDGSLWLYYYKSWKESYVDDSCVVCSAGGYLEQISTNGRWSLPHHFELSHPQRKSR